MAAGLEKPSRDLRALTGCRQNILVTDDLDARRSLMSGNAVRSREFLSLCKAEGFDHYVARQNQQLDSISRLEGAQL